jgi:hypothetical protein
MTVPAPLTTSEAMSLLGATSTGRDVAIRRLLDPADVTVARGATTARSDAAGTEASDAAVVVPQLDAATWTAACAAGVAVVVTTAGSGDLPPPDAATPARWWVRDTRLALARLSRRLDPRPPVAAVGVHPTAVVDPARSWASASRWAPTPGRGRGGAGRRRGGGAGQLRRRRQPHRRAARSCGSGWWWRTGW